MKAAIYKGSVTALRPIAERWYIDVHSNRLNIDLDINTHLADLARLIVSDDSDLLVLIDGNTIIGYMGVESFASPYGKQILCNEHYWYVLPEKRGVGSLRLIRLAQQWAKNKGCSHLMITASTLASCLHDKICRLYERMGMQKFETTYIMEI